MTSPSITDNCVGKGWKTNAKCSAQAVAFVGTFLPRYCYYSYWWYLVLGLFYVTSGFPK
jgi:hypothetical protein